MEISGPNRLNYNIEEKALKGLLDSFGTVFTLQEKAFACCNAGRNVDLADETLCDKWGSTSTSTTHFPTGEARAKESLESPYGNISKNPCPANEMSRPSKTKWRPVSGDLAGEILGDEQGSTSTSITNFPTREARAKESSESTYGNISKNPCPANGRSEPSKTKWLPVSRGRNADLAGEILCDGQGRTSTSTTNFPTGEVRAKESSQSSYGNIFKNPCPANGKFRLSKTKWRPVSGDLAGEILCDKQGSTSTSTTHFPTGEARAKESSGSSNDNISKNPCPANGKFGPSKTKWRPVPGGRNVDLAAEIMCDKQGSTSTSTTNFPIGEARAKESSKSSYGNISKNPCLADGKSEPLKTKWNPVSGGRNANLTGEILCDEQGSSLTSGTNFPTGEARAKESSESSYRNISKNPCPANGKSEPLKTKWHPVSGGRNAELVGEILCDKQGSTSTSTTNFPTSEARAKEYSESSYGDISENPYPANGNSEPSKKKWHPVARDLAGEILCDKQGSTSTSTTHFLTGEARAKESSDSSNDNISKNPCPANGKSGPSKTKWLPVSGGRNVDSAAEIMCDEQRSTSTSITSLPTGEAKAKEFSESSYGNISKNPCPANGKSGPSKTKWHPVSGDLPGEILCGKQGSTSTFATHVPTGEAKAKESSESSNGNISKNPCPSNGKSGPSKTKWRPVSGGRNENLAGEILCDKQGSSLTSGTNFPAGEARAKESSESSYGNISKNPCPANGKSGPSETKWCPVSGGRNSDLAGEILCDKQGSTSSSTNHFPTSGARFKESSKSSYGNISLNPCPVNGNSGPSKTEWSPVSGGTVSIGKDYVKPTQPANGSGLATKPLELDSKEFPISALWGEGTKSNPSKNDRLQKDMEDLLFRLLGVGFKLSRDVIREVLDSCGYDMPKSMLKLLDHSAETLDERMKSLGKSSEKRVDMSHTSGGLPSERKLQQSISFGSCGKRNSDTNKEELLGQPKDRNQLQKEVLAALFNAPEKSEELPDRTVKTVRRSKAFGQVVTEPLRDFEPGYKTDWMLFQQDNENVVDDGKEDSFQALRRAVMEYRGAMKEYCKAAVDAFSKGDHEQAAKLVEQGQFFYEKAREADEESNKKIFETRNSDTQNDLLLDLHVDGPKEAIRLLKCHLSSLSGIPSIKYLKVILETDDQDTTKGTRRRLVMKLLERESIQWIGEGNPGTILIALDKIKPKCLSFAKK